LLHFVCPYGYIIVRCQIYLHGAEESKSHRLKYKLQMVTSDVYGNDDDSENMFLTKVNDFR